MMLLGGAGFDETNAIRGVLRQAACDQAARGARADDDVVELAIELGSGAAQTGRPKVVSPTVMFLLSGAALSRQALSCYVRSRLGDQYSEEARWISARRSTRAAARIVSPARYAPEYRAVVDAFIENFRVEDEVGAACSIVLDGRTVVDIWGGWRDRAEREPWDAPTTVCMMSVAKGITAICFNMLIDRGLVDPNARVIEYWPEYGRNGKEKTLVRHFLDHTAAVPVLTTNPLWPGAMLDREAIVKALEEQEPLWEIGTKAAYHVHHQGFLLGEIMRRVTGKTVGPFLRKEVSDAAARRVLHRRDDARRSRRTSPR